MTGRGGIAVAVALSVALHLGGAGLFAGVPAPAVEGTASSEPVRLGSGFEDLSLGAQPATPAEETITYREPSVTAATPVTAISEHTDMSQAATPPKPPGATPTPMSATEVMTAAVAEAPSPAPLTAAPSDAAAASPAETPEAATPEAPQLTASEPVETALAASPRPEPRPQPRSRTRPETRPETQPERQAVRASADATPGADRNERRGQADGAEAATATEATAPAAERRAAAKQGDAAASNYPGLVMRQLSRTSRPSAGRRGTAVVGFEVGAGGELRRVVILQSSGHDTVDRAAIDHVSRAAPFPPPPDGAQTRFQVEYESRG